MEIVFHVINPNAVAISIAFVKNHLLSTKTIEFSLY
jgi:hypothetical protein